MKVSISKFYKEVTGKTTVNSATCTAALERWGVPFDDMASKTKGDAVDVSHLELAKKVYATEVAAHDARVTQRADAKKARANGTPPLVDDGELLRVLVQLDDNVVTLGTKLDALLKHLKVSL